MKQNATILIIAIGAVITSHATDIISPSGGPFGSADIPFFVPTARYQQVYGASDFGAISPAGGFISEIWFGRAQSSPDFPGAILQNVALSFSTTAKAVDGLSSVFAENRGADAKTVHSGPLPFSSSDADLPFTTRIQLDQPFYYNPAVGNLLLEIENHHGLPQAPIPPLFGVTTSSSTIDAVSVAWSFDLSSPTARAVGAGGLLTKFVVTPVPEPSPLVLSLLGLAGLVVAVFWRRSDSASGFGSNGGTDGPGPVRRYVVENNVIELGVRKLRDDPLATINRAIAIAAYGGVYLSVTHAWRDAGHRAAVSATDYSREYYSPRR